MQISLGDIKTLEASLFCAFCLKEKKYRVCSTSPDTRYVLATGWNRIAGELWCGTCDPRKKEKK